MKHPDIDALVLPILRQKSGSWAAYQNHVLGDPNGGNVVYLQVGPGRTHTVPPPTYPDSQLGAGWKYLFIGLVDLEKGVIRPLKHHAAELEFLIADSVVQPQKQG